MYIYLYINFEQTANYTCIKIVRLVDFLFENFIIDMMMMMKK